MGYSASDVRARRQQPSSAGASAPIELDEKPKDPSYGASWPKDGAGSMAARPYSPVGGVNGIQTQPTAGGAAAGAGPTAGFKADPTHSFKLTEGWVHHEKPKVYAKGKQRKDGSRGGPLDELWDRVGGGLDLSEGELKLLVVITTIAGFVRYWKIWSPSSVVFDEVHFGGFASKYIKSAFFMDVHPPLAKMLIALVGWVAGFNGNFKFKDIGDDYLAEHVPYVAMRLLPATLGVALVPLSYLTLRMLSLRPASAMLGSLLFVFENGLITQSRLILLDSPLLFFTALTAFFHIGFCNEDAKRGFTVRWWAWLAATGIGLGAVVSCKWVGLFTIATVGLVTIKQLWDLLGDLRVPIPLLVRHFIARAICLIILPSLFYMLMFAIHFAILSGSGEGDAFMTSEFQHTLRGHGMPDTYADVLLGSNITIRHLNTQGGYLHSHPHHYPGGSKQQQITLYPHDDTNNLWTILMRLDSEGKEPLDNLDEKADPPRYVEDGMTIRLHHPLTGKKLHSHDVRSSVTEVDYQNEVSGYGFEDFPGDVNDEWTVEIVARETDRDPYAKKRLRTLRTKFRLRHSLQGCYLFSHKVKLPDWGFEQQEVTCNKNPTMANSLWFIETSTHKTLEGTKADKVNYRRPGFLKKFTELQAVMWTTNAGLTDRHSYDSRPHQWPLLRRGINFWGKDKRQIYLLGNPFIWWLSSASIAVYAGMRALLILRQKRGYKDLQNTTVAKYDGLAGYLVLGWALHYFPFFIMNRQLFLHHYFPALYFAVLLICTIFDLATRRLNPKIQIQIAGVLLLVTVWTWYHFSPVAYGGNWTKSKCEAAKWRNTWDFSCSDFPEKLEDYKPKGIKATTGGSDGSPATSSAPGVEPIPNAFGDANQADNVPKSSGIAEPDGVLGEGEIRRAQERVRQKGQKAGGQSVDEAEQITKAGHPEVERAKAEAEAERDEDEVQLPLQPGATTGDEGELRHLAGEALRPTADPRFPGLDDDEEYEEVDVDDEDEE